MHNPPPVLTPTELESLLSADGARIDISARCALSAPFYLECRPGKATMFAPGLGPHEKGILQGFARREAVIRVAAAQGVQVVVGKDFVDCGRTKLQGLEALQAHRQSALLDCSRKHAVALLDSRNDEGIVLWVRRLATTGRKTIVFVGKDPDFVRDVLGQASDVLMLEGRGIDGTATVMQSLVEGRNPQPTPAAAGDCSDLVSDRLQGIRLANLLLASDLTGTILDQVPRRFPDDLRSNLRQAIEGGATFILVSGDALEVIQEYFTIGDLSKPYYVISSGGFRLDEVQHSQSRWSWTAPPIEPEARRTLLEEALATIREASRSAT